MSLFGSKKTRGRRPAKRRRREHLLEVTATAETERRRRNQKIVLYAGEAMVLLGLAAFAWIGIKALISSQFTDNTQYNVRVVEVNSGGLMSREEALEITGIREGLNIFSLNLEAAQRALSSIPEIKSARVERILPDTVTIEIDPRRPVAWVAPKDTGSDPSAMPEAGLVDGDGFLMKPAGFAAGHTLLPVVYGVQTGQWQPGEKVDLPELRAAIELFTRAAERNNPEIVLKAADISKGWCILAWGDPQTRFTFGVDNLSEQLDRLQFIMLHVAQTSRKIATANLIPERNTPVTFQGDPPPAGIVPEVVAKKPRP